MRSTHSEPTPESGAPATDGYFCTEPWTGVVGIATNRDVIFCPCHLQMHIGNLDEASMQEIWNAPVLVAMRRAFTIGVLPAACEGQLCPVVLRGDRKPGERPPG